MKNERRGTSWMQARRLQLLAVCAAWAMVTLGCLTATHALEVVQREDGAGNVTVGGKIRVEYEIHEPLYEYLKEQETSPNPDGTEQVDGWTIEQAEDGRIIRLSREFTTVQEFAATVPAMETLLGGDEESDDLITGLEVISRTLESGGMEFEMTLTLLIPEEEEDEAVGESLFGTDDPELLAALEASGDPRFLVSMAMPGLIVEATDNDEASGDAFSESGASWEFGPDDVGEHVLRVVSVVGPGAEETEEEQEEEEEGTDDQANDQADDRADEEAEAALLELMGTPTNELLDLLAVVETVTPYATAESLAVGDALSGMVARTVEAMKIPNMPPDLISAVQGVAYLGSLTDERGKSLFPTLNATSKVLIKMWEASLEDEDALLAAMRLQSILIRQDLGRLAAKAAVP